MNLRNDPFRQGFHVSAAHANAQKQAFFIDSFICTVGGRDTWPLLHLFMCDIYVSVTKKPYCAIHPSIAFALHGVLGVGWGGGAGAFPS